jgi:flagellar biosynthesis/type III secretory pathway protein FliH
MTPEPTPLGEPENNGPVHIPPSSVPEELAAREYIASEVRQASVSLQRTRLVCIVSTLIFLGYMWYLTAGLGRILQPRSAAETMTGLINEHVQEQAQDLAGQMQQRIPTLIAQIPDYAIQQMPSYREKLEQQFSTSLTTQCNTLAPQLQKQMDDYLDSHKDQVKDALTAGQDPAAVKEITSGMTEGFLAALKERPAGGESVQDKLDSSLQDLQAIQAKMDRLANATDLTPEEKKTRHAIAVMATQINKNVPKAGIVQPATSTPTGTL